MLKQPVFIGLSITLFGLFILLLVINQPTLLEQIEIAISTPQAIAAIIAALATLSGAVIAYLSNQFVRKRQEYFEMSQYKMDTIAQSRVYYTQLSRYHGQISSLIGYAVEYGRDKIDHIQLVYYISCVNFLEDKILREVGELQLNDIQAEKITRKLGSTVMMLMHPFFSPYEIYRLISLVSGSSNASTDGLSPESAVQQKKNYGIINLREYKKIIYESNNDDIRLKFEEWLFLILSDADLLHIEQSGRFFIALVAYQVNQIFKTWYKEVPSIKSLAEEMKLGTDLRDFLKNNHPDYYSKIEDSE